MSNGLCAGLGEHHRLCRGEHVNVQRCGALMETTWWKLPLKKGAFITATAVMDETPPALASPSAIQVLGLWSVFL